MKKQTWFVLAIALTFSLALSGCKKTEKVIVAGPAPTEPVELKLKWPVGSKIIYDMEMKQNSETRGVPGMPAPMKQEMTMNMQLGLQVLRELADGGHEIEMEFLRMRLEVAAANQPNRLQFDSNDKSSATNPAAAVLQKLVGARLQFFLDTSNEVWKVEGADELEKRLSGGQNDVMAGVFAAMFKKDYFKEIISQNARILPGKPVQPGDSWPVQQEIPLGELGDTTMDYTYTFKSWERRDEHNCARLEYTGTVKGNLKANLGPNARNMQMNMSFDNAKAWGEAWFDFELGRFIENTGNQDMTMLITMPNPQRRGGAATPATITLTNETSQVVTVKLQPNR